jgi:hypothetical protein
MPKVTIHLHRNQGSVDVEIDNLSAAAKRELIRAGLQEKLSNRMAGNRAIDGRTALETILAPLYKRPKA